MDTSKPLSDTLRDNLREETTHSGAIPAATPMAFDGYALDDTLPGRIAQALAVAAVTSYPGWIKGRGQLAAAYLASAVGLGGLVAVFNAHAEDAATQPPRPDRQAAATATAAASAASTAPTATAHAAMPEPGTTAAMHMDDAAMASANEPVASPRWWVAPAAVAVVVGGMAANVSISRWAARGLRRLGITRPWTVLSVGTGLAAYAVSELESHDIAAREDRQESGRDTA